MNSNDDVAFMRSVSAAARALPGPHPTDALLQSIMDDRAAGVRVILPVAGQARWPYFAIGLASGLSAAALLLVLLRPASTVPASLASFHMGFMPSIAAAQEPASLDARFPVLTGLDGTRLSTGVWTYELRVTNAEPEAGRIEVLREPAGWRVSNAFLGHPHDLAESVLFHATSLQPLTRHATNVGTSLFTVDQRITRDSVSGTMATASRSRRIARALPQAGAPFLAGEGSIFVMLRGLPLRDGLEGRFSVLGWGAMTNDLYYVLTIDVVGKEAVYDATQKRDVDAWRVNFGTGSGMLTAWARTSDGVMLRGLEKNGDTTAELILTKETTR